MCTHYLSRIATFDRKADSLLANYFCRVGATDGM